jgi:hypothetical protein
VPVLDPSVDAPPDWSDWTIEGDGHPDARAHRRVAELLLPRLLSLTADDLGR